MQNKIVIGTANFDYRYGLKKNKLSKFNKNKIINFCINNKLRYFDTAIDYKLKKINLKKFKVISKIKLPKRNTSYFIQNLENIIQNELKKFNLKYFNSVLIHQYNDLLKKNGKMYLNALNLLKKKGLIKKIGISIYSEKEIVRTLKIFKPKIIQFPINIFNQNVLSKKMINFLKKKKILIQARSIFLQGLLLQQSLNKLDVKFDKKIKLNFEKLKYFCNKNKISQLDLCVSFIKSKKFIDLITLGIENENQISEFIKSSKKKIKVNYSKFDVKNKNLTDPRKWEKKIIL